MSVHCKTQSLIYFMRTATDSVANTKDDTTLKDFVVKIAGSLMATPRSTKL